MNAIEIKGLTKRFPDFTLGPIELTLPGGCVMGLIGENGAGKTTTIRLLLGAIRPDQGSFTLLGQDSGGDLTVLREDLGVVFDEPGFPECITARELGKVMSGIYRRWDREGYSRLIKELSLPSEKPFKDFSRGMKMKLSIAVALSHRARLLLLDEPTGGLDPVVRDEVLELFNDFTRDEEHSILISSHIVSDLEKLCDLIAFLHKGQLLLCEEKDRLLEQHALWRGSAEALRALPQSAVLHAKLSPYGAEALVLREALPQNAPLSPISMEELFLYMVKEAK